MSRPTTLSPGRAALLIALFMPAAAAARSGECLAAEPDATRIETLEARVMQLEQALAAIRSQLVTIAAPPGDGAEARVGTAALVDTVPSTPLSASLPAVATLRDTSAELTARRPALVPETPVARAQDADQASGGGLHEPGREPYGGYMEVHFNEDEFEPGTADLHRFVLLFGHQFSDRIRFQGEVEIEHGLVEGGEESGELEVEQAYLDFSVNASLSARAGMMLTPIGIVNEKHEPSAFHGVERPFVDTFVIPSTWFANGAGVSGRFGNGFSYRAFLMSPLNAAFFSAEEGFREGRQKGFLDDASNLAAALRLEYTGIRNLRLGASYWNGNTGFEFSDFSANAQFAELDAHYRLGRVDLTGQYVTTRLDDTVQLNRALQRRTGVNPNIAEEMLGYYLEGAVRLRPRTARLGLVGFYRYELFNTQEKMAPGLLPLHEFNRSANTVGFTLFPHPDIALKLDYNFLDNESALIEASDKWNLGIGWWF